MKKYLFLLLFAAGTAHGGEFSFGRTDHQLHMLASYGGSLTLTRLFSSPDRPRWKSVLYGSLVMLSVGLAKETLYDEQFSRSDMTANGIGILIQAGITLTFSL